MNEAVRIVFREKLEEADFDDNDVEQIMELLHEAEDEA